MSKKATKTKNKTKARTKSAPRPDAAQINAVERLVQNQQYKEAEARARTLLKRFPDYSGLYSLLIDILEAQGEHHGAGALAFEWAEFKPNSVPAQWALLQRCARFGHIFLMLRTTRRLQALGADTQGVPIPDAALLDEMRTMPDGRVATDEEMAAFDAGKLFVDARDFAGALAVLENVEILSARNNFGTALFHLELIEDALEAFTAGWQADGDNLYALAWMIRMRCYLGDEDSASGLVSPLAVATPRRTDDAVMQLDGLLFMGEDETALAAFERARKQPWFGDGEPIATGYLYHFAACASARCGDLRQARQYWKTALETTKDLHVVRDNLDAIGGWDKAHAYPAMFDMSRTFPLDWLGQLPRQANAEAAKALQHNLSALTASPAYLERIYRTGDPAMRGLAVLLLRFQVTEGDAQAAERLKGFAALPIGSDDDRMQILQFLRQQGGGAHNDAINLWRQGKVQPIKLIAYDIHREQEPPDLPPALHALLEDSIDKSLEKDFSGAEDGLQQILAQVPDHRTALGNLGYLLLRRGEREAGEAMLRRVIALYPDYLHPRCNLARVLIRDNRLDEAQELLTPLHTRERFHIQDYFLMIGTTAALNAARGDLEGANKMVDQLESIVETEEDAARLEEAKNMILAYLPRPVSKRVLDLFGKLAKRSR